MPHILSPIIEQNSSGMWFEGPAYTKRNVYSIGSGKIPPVNYDIHTIGPHSLTHLETPAHTIPNGKRLDFYYREKVSCFYGAACVIKLPGNNYEAKGNGIFHWVVKKEEIINGLASIGVGGHPERLLISTELYPINAQGYHDPNYVLTLSQEAADFLISDSRFCLFGTSWKSSDYNPGKTDRPIHNTIFKTALILENLNLKEVPNGIYFLTAFPLPLKDASESPVVPVLFTQQELSLNI